MWHIQFHLYYLCFQFFLFLIVFILYCLYDVPVELLMLEYPLRILVSLSYLLYVQGIIHSINRVIPVCLCLVRWLEHFRIA